MCLKFFFVSSKCTGFGQKGSAVRTGADEKTETKSPRDQTGWMRH